MIIQSAVSGIWAKVGENVNAIAVSMSILDSVSGPAAKIMGTIDELSNRLNAVAQTAQRLDMSSPFESAQQHVESVNAALDGTDEKLEKTGSVLGALGDSSPFEDMEKHLGSVGEVLDGVNGKLGATDSLLQKISSSPAFIIVPEGIEKAASSADNTNSAIRQMGESLNIAAQPGVLETMQKKLDAVGETGYRISAVFSGDTAKVLAVVNVAVGKVHEQLQKVAATKAISAMIAQYEWAKGAVIGFGNKATAVMGAVVDRVAGAASAAKSKVMELGAKVVNIVNTSAVAGTVIRATIGTLAGVTGEVAYKLSNGLYKAEQALNSLGKGVGFVAGKMPGAIDKVNQLLNPRAKAEALYEFFKSCAMMNPQVKEMADKMQSSFDNIKANLGAQLAPAILKVMQVILDNMPKIERVLQAVIPIIIGIIDVIGWLVEGAFKVFDVFYNWIGANIQPILIALAVLLAILAVKAMIAGVTAAISFLSATWPLLLIIGIITAVIMIVHKLGASFEDIFGFIGYIVGGAVGFIVNQFLIFWNFIGGFVNSFARIFDDPIAGIVGLFLSMFRFILDRVASVASVMDAVFGTNIAGKIEGFGNDAQDWYDKTFGKTEQIIERQENVDFGAWAEKGAGIGGKAGAALENFKLPELPNMQGGANMGMPNMPGGANMGLSGHEQMSNIANQPAALAGSAGRSADLGADNLSYLRGSKESEPSNRVTPAEIRIEQNNENYISSDMDLDYVIDMLVSGIRGAVEQCAEGVHI